jgi:hypothetical protein
LLEKITDISMVGGEKSMSGIAVAAIFPYPGRYELPYAPRTGIVLFYLAFQQLERPKPTAR